MAVYTCINKGCLFTADIISNEELINCPQCNVMLMREPDQALTDSISDGDLPKICYPKCDTVRKFDLNRLQQLEERISELEKLEHRISKLELCNQQPSIFELYRKRYR
jgi:DNA-directed RNA polymerase subunit RPC12/RpoP